MSSVTINGHDVTIERFTLTKGMRVITLLSLIQKIVPQISKEISQFKREYADANVVELDRVQAKIRFGPTPLLDGADVVRDADANVVTMPSPIDRMTEQDWERSGHVLRLRQSPSNEELMLAIFPLIYEQAQAPLLRLLALVAMPNSDIERYAQISGDELWTQVDQYAQSVIGPAYLEEIIELAVTAAEQVEGQVMTKVRGLGERVGKLGRLLGIQTATMTSPATSPTSSGSPAQPSSGSASDSRASSDGTPTASSASPGTPSTSSATSSSESTTASAS